MLRRDNILLGPSHATISRHEGGRPSFMDAVGSPGPGTSVATHNEEKNRKNSIEILYYIKENRTDTVASDSAPKLKY